MKLKKILKSAALLLAGLGACTAMAALDNGVDASNIGKGDWIWIVSNAEANAGVSSVTALMNFEKAQGCRWVIVKGADGGDTADWGQFNSSLVTAAHNAGLKVFAMQYVYGSYLGSGQVQAEINAANYLLGIKDSAGVPVDGLMIDAEYQYNGESSDAITYCSGIRAKFPNRFLTHSPYPVPSYNTSFPYIEFGRYCNNVMPQDYWYDQFSSSGGVTPQYMATLMGSDWLYWQGVWQGEGDGSSVKPLAPIGQGFQGASPSPIPGSQLIAFVNALKSTNNPATAGGYAGVSYWVCDQHTADDFNAIAGLTYDNIKHVDPTLGINSDGRMEMFVVGKTGPLYHNYQTNINAGWSGWISMGGTWAQNAHPKVLRNANGKLEVFIIGTNGQLNHAWENTAGNSTSWTGWSTFSSALIPTVKVGGGTNLNGALDIFCIGTDGAMYEMHQTAPGAGWSSWANFGGTWDQDADIANGNDADGRQEIMVIGSTGNLYTKFQTNVNGGWTGSWVDLGGSFEQGFRTALGRNSDGRLEMFIIDRASTALYHNYQTAANSSWAGWSSLGGSWEIDAKPVVAPDKNGALEVLIIGHTGNMYHDYQSGGGWSGFLSIGNTFTQNVRPVVGPNQDGRLEVFTTGSGSDIVTSYETSANSATWSSWTSLGGSWN